MIIKRILQTALVLTLLGGCASRTMSLTEMEEGDVAQASVVLFSLRIENQLRAYHQLEPISLQIKRVDGSHLRFHFPADPARAEKNVFNEYFAAVVLDPGEYTLVDVRGVAGPAAEQSEFVLPLDASIKLGAGEKLYAGFVYAVVVDREYGERKAGKVQANVPLDITGLSRGKFEVKVLNRLEADEKYFKEAFPFLAKSSFVKSLIVPKAVSKPVPKGPPSDAKLAETDSPFREKSEPRAINPPKCTVHQVLQMKDLGLAEAQIKAACE